MIAILLLFFWVTVAQAQVGTSPLPTVIDAAKNITNTIFPGQTAVPGRASDVTTSELITKTTEAVTMDFGTTPSLPPDKVTKKVKIGLLFIKDDQELLGSVGYRTSAGAILVAQDTIRREHLLDEYEFEYVIGFDECIEKTAVGLAVKMILDDEVNIIFGPTCNTPAIATAVLASYYDIPIYTWGLTSSSDLANVQRFPSTIILSPNYLHLSNGILGILKKFNWFQFAFVYSPLGDTEKCPYFRNDLQTAISDGGNEVVMSYMYEFRVMTPEDLKAGLKNVAQKARVVVACMVEGYGYRRSFMLAAHDMGMTTDEYVYIFADINSRGYQLIDSLGQQFMIWSNPKVKDGRDEDAKTAFRKTFMLSDILTETANNVYTKFGEQVISKMALPPFSCTTDCKGAQYQTVSSLAGHLYDAFYIYAHALNRSIAQEGESALHNGTAMLINAAGTYSGMPTDITISANGGMVPKFYFAGLNTNYEVITLGDVQVNNNASAGNNTVVGENGMTFDWLVGNDRDVFVNFGGIRPLDVPICGFMEDACPVSFVATYLVWVIIAAVIVVAAVVAAVLGVVFSVRAKMKETERLNMMWKIPFQQLTRIKQKVSSISHTSLQSSQSDNSKSTSHFSERSIESKIPLDEKVQYFYYLKEPVMGVEHRAVARIEHSDYVEMRLMRQTEHDTINRFIGLSIDGPNYFSLWRFCSRGSLQNVIMKGNMPMDAYFVHSLLTDIVNGINFIHSSFLKVHGNITSKTCLIDDRWQVKLSSFGLTAIRKVEQKPKDEMLWMAPELLRMDNMLGTQPGDIYAFAIVASELVCKSAPWNIDNRNETPDEIVHMVMKSMSPPFRPDLELSSTMEINPTMVHLIRDCWSDNQAQRPDAGILRTLMRNMYNGKKINLMDHVMATLEEYASNLEHEVEERMKELVEEKKKSDLLLYRMLPRQVAEKLKVGQNVEPEGYGRVTLFFSDVVGFTTIAARCTPLQVVSLLNSLYTIFDGIIEAHDVYKVETIGDAYLCVSGLPKRNGNEHIREISELSLDLIQALRSFAISFLNNERVQIRIGMHVGSCVAGVVGLTMPRYCLFGDSVNTASRMESNGKPSMIHLSSDAHSFLTTMYRGQYETEPRGEVLIKGKGVMETFWLTGRNSAAGHYSPPNVKTETPTRSVSPF